MDSRSLGFYNYNAGGCMRMPQPQQSGARSVSMETVNDFMNAANGNGDRCGNGGIPAPVDRRDAVGFARGILSGQVSMEGLSRREQKEMLTLSQMVAESPRFGRVYAIDGNPDDLSVTDIRGAQGAAGDPNGLDWHDVHELDDRSSELIDRLANDPNSIDDSKSAELDKNGNFVRDIVRNQDALQSPESRDKALRLIANAGVLTQNGQDNGLRDYLMDNPDDPFAQDIARELRSTWGINDNGKCSSLGQIGTNEAKAVEDFLNQYEAENGTAYRDGNNFWCNDR